MSAGKDFEFRVPEGHTVFAYVLEGEVIFGDDETVVGQTHLVVLSGGTLIKAQTYDDAGRFILLAGKPLKEPIVQHGPFVMNTTDEIRQAILDYQAGKF